MANKRDYCVIQWIEDPPKWDVVSVKAIRGDNLEVGMLADVEWNNGYAQAKIIDIGKKAAMEEQLKRIIAGQELEGEDSDKELLILGRGQRDKKRKVLSDDGEDDDEAKCSGASQDSRKTKTTKVGLDIERKKGMAVLMNLKCRPKDAESDDKECQQCIEKDSLIKRLQQESTLAKDVRKLLNQLTEKQPLGQQTVLTEQKKTPNVHPLSPNKSSRKPADMKVTAATQLAQYEMARLLSSPSAPTVMCDGEFIILGPATKITKSQYLSIAWNDAWAATRDLATIVFGRKVLATHTLSGMSSNAKRNCTDYTAKPALPGGQVIDIIDFMKAHFPQEENVVRRALTAKCSDEAKCLKQKSKSHVVDTGEKPEVEHSLKELSGFNL